MASQKSHSDIQEGSAFEPRSLFGRRKGRPLSKERQNALDTLLPLLDLAPLLEQKDKLDINATFGPLPFPLWLEIGFGNGEHLAELMCRHPDTRYIGVEPFVNGMAAFLKSIQKENHERLRVLMDDAVKLCEALPDGCLDGIYILNPDPWPKTRHHKRRIVNPDNLNIFARILKPGGQLIMTSDVPDLADWMVTHANNHPAFTWTAKNAADWQTPPEDWITTRYETKGANGAQKMCYLFFERNP